MIRTFFLKIHIHVHFFKVDVVFYSAIYDGVLAVFTASFILIVFPFFKIFTSFEKIQMIFICILGSYIFAISLPTVLDRSLYFYII